MAEEEIVGLGHDCMRDQDCTHMDGDDESQDWTDWEEGYE